jgi:uncharacterized phiE125 gp8 family phage protein
VGLELVTPPSGEPVVPTEAVEHLRLDADTDEDELLAAMVTAAREQVEVYTRRALLTQTWRLTLDAFPECNTPIRVPRPPLQSVTSVQYVDLAGVTQVLDPAEYAVDTTGVRGRIAPAYGKSWPLARSQLNAVTITFVAGYGDAAKVPEGIKAAIKLLLGSLYENRETVITGTIVAELPTVKALLTAHRAPEF